MGWTAPDGIDGARMGSLQMSNEGDRPWNRLTELAPDVEKHFLPACHGVNAAEKVVLRKKLRRKEMVVFFEALAPTVIRIESLAAASLRGRVDFAVVRP